MATNRTPGSHREADRWGDEYDNPLPTKPQKKFKWKYVFYGLLLVLIVDYGWEWLAIQGTTNTKEKIEKILLPSEDADDVAEPAQTRLQQDEKNNFHRAETDSRVEIEIDEDAMLPPEDIDIVDPVSQQPVREAAPREEEYTAKKSTEQRNSNRQREKSISELLEERTHADVVKQAKRAGVSTEGSTSEILERITHADVVKQAKRAGVSTEGSTSEILERITHADVVKQAKRAGVSTEGSTSEILERITRKSLEEYNW